MRPAATLTLLGRRRMREDAERNDDEEEEAREGRAEEDCNGVITASSSSSSAPLRRNGEARGSASMSSLRDEDLTRYCRNMKRKKSKKKG